jgi:D-amino-acid dehydrogenase
MTRDETLGFEPSLREDIAGSWYYQQDAFLRPDRLMQAWRKRLQTRGVQFLEQREMQGFTRNGRSVKAVKTSQGELEADYVVISAGAWSPMLQEYIGTKLPIQPGKGYSMTMSKPTQPPRVAMLLPEHRVGVTPMQSGYRLGSIMELAGYDDSLREERLRLLTDGAKAYLRDPLGSAVEERWFGWRPMTYDSMPIIDRASQFENVWIAAGHNMLGLSMAPATGRLLTELMTEQSPHIDPLPYRASRFKSA